MAPVLGGAGARLRSRGLAQPGSAVRMEAPATRLSWRPRARVSPSTNPGSSRRPRSPRASSARSQIAGWLARALPARAAAAPGHRRATRLEAPAEAVERAFRQLGPMLARLVRGRGRQAPPPGRGRPRARGLRGARRRGPGRRRSPRRPGRAGGERARVRRALPQQRLGPLHLRGFRGSAARLPGPGASRLQDGRGGGDRPALLQPGRREARHLARHGEQGHEAGAHGDGPTTGRRDPIPPIDRAARGDLARVAGRPAPGGDGVHRGPLLARGPRRRARVPLPRRRPGGGLLLLAALPRRPGRGARPHAQTPRRAFGSHGPAARPLARASARSWASKRPASRTLPSRTWTLLRGWPSAPSPCSSRT